MAVRLRIDGTMVLTVLAAGAIGYVWYRSEQLGESVSDAADEAVGAVNPADKRNLINRSFNWWYRTTTGSDGTLGGDIADWTSRTPDLNPTTGDDTGEGDEDPEDVPYYERGDWGAR